MKKNYYEILGIKKDASKDEIKKAFRVLAHKHHPDKKDGNEAKFKEANEAYQVLSDDQKRAQYDQFGSAGPRFNGFSSQGGPASGWDFSGFQNGNFNGQNVEFDLGDIFGEMFGGGGGGFRRMRRGRNIALRLHLTFKESIFGAKKKIKIPSESAQSSQGTVEIDIPAGVESGQQMKLQGYGAPAEGGPSAHAGQPGDLYLEMEVETHKTLRKEGMHLVTEITIPISVALLGGSEEINLIDDSVTIKIPAGIVHGSVLRVRGRGVQAGTFRSGDLLVKVTIAMPHKLSREQKELIEKLQKSGL